MCITALTNVNECALTVKRHQPSDKREGGPHAVKASLYTPLPSRSEDGRPLGGPERLDAGQGAGHCGYHQLRDGGGQGQRQVRRTKGQISAGFRLTSGEPTKGQISAGFRLTSGEPTMGCLS